MKRLRRARKPETLQRFRQKRLQPWLDFAASVKFTEPVAPPWQADQPYKDRFLEEHAGLKSGAGAFIATRFPANSFFPLGAGFNHSDAARDFYHFFWTVRTTLEWIIEAWLNRDRWPSFLNGSVGFFLPAMEQTILMSRSGSLTITANFAWNLFLSSINGLDVHRLRRCPFPDCRKIFYAVRANTGACREHLERARVQRGRDPELRRQYEETRRINRLVRMGKPLSEARTDVARKAKKRRKSR